VLDPPGLRRSRPLRSHVASLKRPEKTPYTLRTVANPSNRKAQQAPRLVGKKAWHTLAVFEAGEVFANPEYKWRTGQSAFLRPVSQGTTLYHAEVDRSSVLDSVSKALSGAVRTGDVGRVEGTGPLSQPEHVGTLVVEAFRFLVESRQCLLVAEKQALVGGEQIDASQGVGADAAERLHEADRIEDPLAQLHGVVRLLHVLDDDGELVAAEPRHGVDLAHRCVQPFGGVDQDLISHLMPQRVIDHLELVQVAEQHGELPAVAQGIGDCQLQPVTEHVPVR